MKMHGISGWGSRPAFTRVVAVTVAVGVLVVASACSSSKSTSTTGTTGSGGSSGGSATNCMAAAKVPSNVKSAGQLNAATDASYAPMEFIGTDGTTIEGADIDLGNAVAKQLGLTAKWQNVKFDSIISGIGTRYDMSMSSFSVTAAREKQVCMVSYFTAGTSFMVQTGQNQDITSLSALCGKTVAVETGTTEQTDAEGQSTKCKSAGKAAVTVLTFPDQNGANLALTSGRAQAGMADSPVAAYAAKQSNGAIEVVGDSYGSAPYGIVLPNTSEYAGLASSVLGALKTLDSNGTYKQILDKWGISSGAISNFAINPASS
jgi:polar amino acid transport system substrate-binding protein